MFKNGDILNSSVFGSIEIQERIASGGQGTVYKINTSGQQYALKWYNKLWSTPDQYARISKLVEVGAPKDPPDVDARFAWPIDIVGTSDDPEKGFGYIMPLVPGNFETNGYLIAQRIRNPFVLCEMSRQLTEAFRALHISGFCYQDISEKNIKVEPNTGDISILDNDNVVVDKTAATQIGTPSFIAPEVVRQENYPCSASDLHSLAVLLFHFWMWHHPFHGRLEFDTICKSPESDLALYGTPVFIFDPLDKSNEVPVNEDGYRNLPARWQGCPEALKKLFVRSFTSGLKDPNERVNAGEWLSAFRNLRDSIMLCSSEKCSKDPTPFLVDLEKEGDIGCHKCGTAIQSRPLKLTIRSGTRHTEIPILPSTRVTSNHISKSIQTTTDKDAQLIGFVDRTNDESKRWILRNASGSAWTLKTSSGKTAVVPGGKACVISPGIEIRMESAVASISK
ncbi:MAG: hypothetical protein ABJL33_18610 [Hyphomicrobiales bacterium]|uniref:protein kinase domain-containing protein n=1 Tax=Roseibium polysiphoniae TaxID=2571221 RepID=UPI00329A49F7